MSRKTRGQRTTTSDDEDEDPPVQNVSTNTDEQLLDKFLTDAIDRKADDDPIKLALKKERIESIDMLLGLTYEDIVRLTFDSQDSLEADGSTPKYKTESLPMGHKSLLVHFRTFIIYEDESTPVSTSIPVPPQPGPIQHNPDPATKAVQDSTQQNQALPRPGPTQQNPDPAAKSLHDWRRGGKRDQSSLPSLKAEPSHGSWNRTFEDQAHAQGAAHVVDDEYPPSNPDEKEVSQPIQTLMHTALESKVQTPKGKEVAREHEATKDAPAAYANLMEHHRKSTGADIEARKINITTATINDGKFKGTTSKFVTNLTDQLKPYENQAENGSVLEEDVRVVQLSRAIATVSELPQIKLTADMLRVSTKNLIDFQQYYRLLSTAAVQYDDSLTHEDNPWDPGGSFDIDTSVSHLEAKTHTYIRSQRSQSMGSPRHGRNQRFLLPKEIWHAFTDEGKVAWDTLREADRTMILGKIQPSSNPQMARIPVGHHLRTWLRSPNPAMNIPRRNEDLLTDYVYSDVPAIDDGSTGAQVFFGRDTHVCYIYDLKSESHFPNALQENIRQRGAPNRLVSDSATYETSKRVHVLLNDLHIGDWQSEPHHQHQNPAERRWQDIKRISNDIMDRTGCLPSCWLLVLCYVMFVMNHSANPTLNWDIPLQRLTGNTVDMSILLRYPFWHKVYANVPNATYPSDTREQLCWMVGFSETVGHAMTYKLLTCDTNKIIHRSSIRSAEDSSTINVQAAPVDGEEINRDSREKLRETIIEAIANSGGKSTKDENTEFRLAYEKSDIEEVLTYQQIMEYLDEDERNQRVWKFNCISGHQGPLKQCDPGYKGSSFNVMIEWENGEVTTEPLNIIAEDDPVTCAIYALDNDLLDTPGWMRFKKLARRQKKLFWMANQAKLRSFRTAPRYIYGIEIPRDYQHALELHRKNGNTLWQDCTALELSQLKEYRTFKDIGKGKAPPPGYKKIRVHLVYACKHDGRRKARLVADGHLTDIPIDSVYSGVVSLPGLRMMIFLAELNNLSLWATDIGNAYLEAYTLEKGLHNGRKGIGSIYGDVEEMLPHDAPKPLGKTVVLAHYVDANLYHDWITGRSVTGILSLLNQTPIDWYSKKQSTVETATYRSEFVATRICIDRAVDLRTTLRYLGVPLAHRDVFFGDNESVVNSSMRLDAKLLKRHNALSFHRVREAIAAGYIQYFHIPGE
ncbi:reverse transcriptase RNA-dependent DNA polymerase [Nitzschia inconspicua]|uniref:Reverse transcriptase RNA-dependent DNA polymerase n=1 Tax=Nitzschia inconspicua TaxID=303405 RepID=A0A9K3KKC1_9STRA|nr:reverse transcriptase RNA-dependent DNA polymerase [Nitzschia inconspicua]